MGVLSLFTNPADAILAAKKSKSVGMTIVLLLVIALLASVITGIGAAMGTKSPSYYGRVSPGLGMGMILVIAVAAFVLVFLGGLFGGWLMGIIMRTLGGKGGFFEGVTSLVYGHFVAAIAGVVFYVLMMVGTLSKNQLAMMIMLVIGLIVMIWGIALSMATFYRSLKELFSTDMITAFVGVVGVMLPIMLMVVVMMVMSMMSAVVYSMGMMNGL